MLQVLYVFFASDAVLYPYSGMLFILCDIIFALNIMIFIASFITWYSITDAIG